MHFTFRVFFKGMADGGNRKHRTLCAFQRSLMIAFFLFLLPITGLHGTCHAETAVIPLQFRQASDLLPLVRKLLSTEGRAAADPQGNALVILDNRETIGKIRLFLAKLDKPVRQAAIRLRFQEGDSVNRRSLAMEGRVSGKNWEVRRGKRREDGFSGEYLGQDRNRAGKSEYFIQVASGSWAYIRVGRDIPYEERWIMLCGRHGVVFEGAAFQRIETGFEVRPVITDQHAELDIMPIISSARESGGSRKVVRFADASTHLSVPLGKWRNIGGIGDQSREVFNAILESGSVKRNSSLTISVMVDAHSF